MPKGKMITIRIENPLTLEFAKNMAIVSLCKECDGKLADYKIVDAQWQENLFGGDDALIWVARKGPAPRAKKG